MKKGGLAGVSKGELVTLLRPSELAAIARRTSRRWHERSESDRDGAAQGCRGPTYGVDRSTLDRAGRPRSLFLNRELSWLDFNDRVLQLAEDESLPLMERVQVPGHLRHEPRRVLHGPRGRRARPGRRANRRPRPRRPVARPRSWTASPSAWPSSIAGTPVSSPTWSAGAGRARHPDRQLRRVAAPGERRSSATSASRSSRC